MTRNLVGIIKQLRTRGHQPVTVGWWLMCFFDKMGVSEHLGGTPITNQFVCYHDGFIKMRAMCVFVLAKLEVSGQIHSRAHDQFCTLGLQFLAFEDNLSTERMAQENLSNPALEIPAFIDTKIYYTGVWFPPLNMGNSLVYQETASNGALTRLDRSWIWPSTLTSCHWASTAETQGFSLERIYILCISMLVYWRAVPELPGIFFYGLTPAKVNKHNLIFGINSWHSRRIMWVWVKILLSCWTWR